jgi:hypothetical protein
MALRLHLLGLVGVEHDLALGRARRGRQAAGDDIARGRRIERGMEQLVKRQRIDARNRLLFGDQPVIDHLDGDPQRGLGGALAAAGLEHPQLALLDGEFEILHVAVMGLEAIADALELGENLRHHLFERGLLRTGGNARPLGQVLRGADPGNHVLALGIDQKLAVELLLAGRGIAGEGDAGGRILAHIAEHHRLHVDGGPPLGGNVVQPAIGDGALVHPRAEHRADGTPELFARVLRKRRPGLLLDPCLEVHDDRHPVVGGQLGVERHAAPVLVATENLLESHDDRRRARRRNTSG